MIAAVCVGLGLVVPTAGAQSEDQVMAAFLYNFARYVEWPKAAFDLEDMPVKICMLNSRAFGEVVSQTVSGKSVGEREVVVAQTSSLRDLAGCHILFVGSDDFANQAETIAALRDRSIFSVSDREGFASAGGIANFFRADNRVRFEINPAAAQKAGLKVSSKLLRLAKLVNSAS